MERDPNEDARLMKSILPNDDSYLTRFLIDVENAIPPKLEDLEAIADALIAMNDHGVSFKKAFDMVDSRGRKPSKIKNVTRSESFQLMSDGWLGQGPFWLMRFLNYINQQLQPRSDDLKEVAIALIKMRENGESLKSAFSIRNKTGHKELDITQLPFKYILRSEKWAIFHTYKKLIKQRKSRDESINMISESRKYSTRHIERILKETNEIGYVEWMTQKQLKSWDFYFSNRKKLISKNLSDAIEDISREQHIKEWDICLNLATLYREVLIEKKYPLITRGKYDYPIRLKKRIKRELHEAYYIVNFVHEISLEDGFIIQHSYNELTINIHHRLALDVINSKTGISQEIINFYLKSISR